MKHHVRSGEREIKVIEKATKHKINKTVTHHVRSPERERERGRKGD